jgi:hypothetical protein
MSNKISFLINCFSILIDREMVQIFVLIFGVNFNGRMKLTFEMLWNICCQCIELFFLVRLPLHHLPLYHSPLFATRRGRSNPSLPTRHSLPFPTSPLLYLASWKVTPSLRLSLSPCKAIATAPTSFHSLHTRPLPFTSIGFIP